MAYILIAERGENDRPNGLYRVLHPTTFDYLLLHTAQLHLGHQFSKYNTMQFFLTKAL